MKFNNYEIFNDLNLGENLDLAQEYELISTAKQTDPRYGEFQLSKIDLEEMAKHLNEDILGTDIPVDENHDPNHKALAWLAKGTANVKPSTKLKGEFSLYSKIDRHTPTGKEAMETGAYRYFSLQIQGRFEKMVGGVKKSFKNVIRSLALTNQPVIKDLAPTFSENILLTNSYKTMELAQLLSLADNFLSEEKVSQAQVVTLKTLSEGLEGDDKTKADEKIAEVEAKAEPTDEEKKAVEEAEAAEAAEAEKAAEKELAEKIGNKKSYNLSEVMDIVKESLKPVSKQLNDVIGTQREKMLTENVDSLILSEGSVAGFKAGSKDELLAFVKTLSDVQAAAYFKLHDDIIASVDLSEYGNALSEDTRDAQTQLSEAIAVKRAADKELSEGDAMKAVLLENKELSDKLSENVQY